MSVQEIRRDFMTFLFEIHAIRMKKEGAPMTNLFSRREFLLISLGAGIMRIAPANRSESIPSWASSVFRLGGKRAPGSCRNPERNVPNAGVWAQSLARLVTGPPGGPKQARPPGFTSATPPATLGAVRGVTSVGK